MEAVVVVVVVLAVHEAPQQLRLLAVTEVQIQRSTRLTVPAAAAAAVRVLTILPPEEVGVMAATMEAEEVPPDAAVLQWGLKVPAGKASSLLRIRPARLLRPSPPTPQALSVRIPRHSTHR